MGDEVASIAQWAAGGGAGGLAFFGARWLMVFFTGRLDKREAYLDKATADLFTRLQTEVKELRAEVTEARTQLEECQREHLATRRELSRLEGIVAGLGDAKQQAALIVAAERRKAQ